MKCFRVAAIATAIVAFSGAAVSAASLQASPVLLEINEKAPSSLVNIRNTGDKPINVQTRVMRWTQQGGQESLVEATDVVASPPIATLQPGANYSVRIVRTSKAPVAREEAYRVLVDQLPDPGQRRSGTVAIVLRHSIPVFMLSPSGGVPKVEWTVSERQGRLVLRATNRGDRRLRLANVSLRLADGREVRFGNGLLGYALAGSTVEWSSPRPAKGAGSAATITASTDLGPLSQSVRVAP